MYLITAQVWILMMSLKLTNGSGVDVVLDYVGPEAFPKNFKMVKKGGRILFCGILTGREVTVSPAPDLLKAFKPAWIISG